MSRTSSFSSRPLCLLRFSHRLSYNLPSFCLYSFNNPEVPDVHAIIVVKKVTVPTNALLVVLEVDPLGKHKSKEVKFVGCRVPYSCSFTFLKLLAVSLAIVSSRLEM